MKTFTEGLRYEYPLTPDSIVWDCGGYHGTFAEIIYTKYRCNVVVFEPIPEHAEIISKRFEGNTKIKVIRAAVAGKTEIGQVFIQGDSSGRFATGAYRDVPFINICHLITGKVDLLKLNIENGEYDVLERIISNEMAPMFHNIQVQFHTGIPDFEKRHANILEKLLVTHDLTFDAPFCWEGFSLK